METAHLNLFPDRSIGTDEAINQHSGHQEDTQGSRRGLDRLFGKGQQDHDGQQGHPQDLVDQKYSGQLKFYENHKNRALLLNIRR